MGRSSCLCEGCLQVDPLGDNYASHTPYQYALNNPATFNDPFGDRISNRGDDIWYSMSAGGSGNPDEGMGGGGGWSNDLWEVIDSNLSAGSGSIRDRIENMQYWNGVASIARDPKNQNGGYISSSGEFVPFSNSEAWMAAYAYNELHKSWGTTLKAKIDPNSLTASLSSSYPPWTHAAIIRQAFKGILTDKQISWIIQGSEDADKGEFQDAEHSYMHAMRSLKQTRFEAEYDMKQYLLRQGLLYMQKMDEGNPERAFYEMGMGMHPLMDRYSPSHEGFQTCKRWDIPGVIKHGIGEAWTTEGVDNAINSIREYYLYWK